MTDPYWHPDAIDLSFESPELADDSAICADCGAPVGHQLVYSPATARHRAVFIDCTILDGRLFCEDCRPHDLTRCACDACADTRTDHPLRRSTR